MEFPWVVETRPLLAKRQSPIWGVLALVAALVSAGFFLVGLGISFVGIGGLVLWLLPVWGILTLVAIAFALKAAGRRGPANVTLAAISGGLVLISNPVLFLVIAFSLGLVE